MNDINDNAKAVQEPRGPALDADKATLTDQIPAGLRKILLEKGINQKISDLWNQGNAARALQLERQRMLAREVDEFIEPLYTKPLEWNSDLHMPVAFTVLKTFHARMYSALLSGEPPFMVNANTEAHMDAATVVQDLLQHTIKNWANQYQGVDIAVDDWIWQWLVSGRGILKLKWDKQFTRFVDIERTTVRGMPVFTADGEVQPGPEEVLEKAKKKDIISFEGPCWEPVDNEDLLILGGEGDPDRADAVIQTSWMTSHELWSLADQRLFDKRAVERVIQGGEDMQSAEPVSQIKLEEAERSGESSLDDQTVLDRYQILEAYLKVDLDNSGIASDVIVWMHKATREILRATYLWRVAKTGETPFAVSDFYRRRGQASALGLVELIYTLTKEIDALHNMKIDFGLLSTMPVGFYRASSSLSKERLPLSPGQLIPLDNPMTDVNFPNMGARHAFAAQEEAALMDFISRVTGISDMQMGVLGAQGAARTATGASAIVNESNANLDIFLRRLQRGFKKALRYTYALLCEKLPAGYEFRLLGRDGRFRYRRVQSREELRGQLDFSLEPNSAASNPQLKISNAQQVLSLVQNPLLIQLGVVTPGNLYEATKNMMVAMGIKDWSKYIQTPPQHTRMFTPEEIANRILAGIDVQLGPEQDLQGFISYFQQVMADDELLGQFSQEQTITLARKAQEAQQMLAALQEMQQQQAVAQQMQRNSQAGTQGALMQQNQAPQNSIPGEQPT